MANRLLVVVPPGSDAHDTGRGHPERIGRVDAVLAGIADADLGDAVAFSDGRAATHAELVLVHDADYVAGLKSFADAGGGHLDADTVVAPGSFVAATRAAGGGLAAAEALRDGTAETAFVVARPPGHHATRHRGQGFCLFNNVAVTAAALVADGERVLIVDWDVHHGNGTQDIFWDDDRVLYVSTHQHPAYPGTGQVDDLGGPGARGLTVNFPFPPGATGDVARRAINDVVAPVAEKFAPTWVLISAGFDAHRADPLADLAWSAADYGLLATRILELVPGGRTIAFLEGGYDLAALRASTATTVAALAGAAMRAQPGEAPTSGGPGHDVVDRVARVLSDLVS